MTEAKIRKVEPTDEMQAFLDAKPGACLSLHRSNDGTLENRPHDPELQATLNAAEVVMDDNRDLLDALG